MSEPGEVKMGGGLEGLRMTFTPQKCRRFHGKTLPTTWAGGWRMWIRPTWWSSARGSIGEAIFQEPDVFRMFSRWQMVTVSWFPQQHEPGRKLCRKWWSDGIDVWWCLCHSGAQSSGSFWLRPGGWRSSVLRSGNKSGAELSYSQKTVLGMYPLVN